MASVDTLLTPTLFYTGCQHNYRRAQMSGAFSWRAPYRAPLLVGNGSSDKGSGRKQVRRAYQRPHAGMLPILGRLPVSDAGAENR